MASENLEENKIQWTDEDVVKALRAKGEADFFFFLREVCEFGYNPDEKGPKITDDQKELCDWLQALYEGKQADAVSDWINIILTPRDTLKSTVLQGFALWIIVKNPDIRILFYGEVHEQAQKRLAVLKRVISSCKTFRLCYGDLDGSRLGLPWNENMVVTANRKSTSIRECTIETAGLDVTVNSRHFDWIFPDDLHSEKNTKSKDQIEGVREKVQLLTPLLTNGGKMVFAGVFWNDSDFHTRLLEEHKPNVFRRSAYVDEAETTARYLHALPIEALNKKKKFMTDDQFSCHYRLNPVSKESQKFKKEYFTLIPEAQFQASRTFILIDGAGDPTSEKSEKRDSDYTGIIVAGVSPSFDICIRNMFMGRVNPTEATEIAISFIMRYTPYVVGIEKAGMGNLAFYLREELRRKGRFAIVEDLMPQGRSKYQRIIELEPLARRRKIFIAQESAHIDDFLDQATKVTTGIKSKHDDLIDPLAYILDLLKSFGSGIIDEDNSDRVPAEYQNLDSISKDYWMSVKRSKEKKSNADWISEFV
jgi:hypothetical protein